MAFTAGGLMVRESVDFGRLYVRMRDWGAVREMALEKNLVQARKVSSAKRLVREVILRLEYLHPEELIALDRVDPPDQARLAWIAVCRRYAFISDFMREVVYDRHLSLRDDLHLSDFDMFFEEKRLSHPELETISDATRRKLRQVLFSMLRDVGLLSTQGQINLPTLGPELAKLLHQAAYSTADYFPLSESDLRANST